MSTNTLTIAQRIILQLLHDRRTLALLIIVPLVIASLIGVIVPDKMTLDFVAPPMLAILIFFFGFILPGINALRERSQGTMERLMASPASRMDIVGGYLLGFLLFALLQTMVLFFYNTYVFDVSFHGELWQILIFQALLGTGAVCMGIFFSILARNEFQMMQFIPLIILPQIVLCGLLWPISQMPDYLQWLANALPLTYGVEGINALMVQGQSLADIGKDVGILAGYAVGMLILAAVTLRRGASS